MLKSVHTVAYAVFIISVVFLTLLAVLSIWDVFGHEVFWKAISTLGVITFSSGITMVVTRNYEREQNKDTQTPPTIN